MKLGIILNTNHPETAWNALRLADKAIGAGNEVNVFLLGKGVEIENIADRTFDVAGTLASFLDDGGKLLACSTCLKVRQQETGICPVSNMEQLVEMISDSDKVISLG